jgi:hypothetical protein
LLGPDALSYDGIHTPMTIRKCAMLDVLDEIGDRMLFRSVYGNREQIGGVESPDAKIRNRKHAGNGPWVSTSDQSFKADIGRRIRRSFPDRSVYEK